MSHGFGKLQNLIRQHLIDNPGWTTFESLRWTLARNPEHDLPAKWNTSLGRALEKLVEEPKSDVVQERRKLITIAECVEHYPGKSLAYDFRQLRLNLLPALAAELVETGTRYHERHNEEYRVRKLKAERALPTSKWSNLEAKLFPLVDDVDVFNVVAKGKSLFAESPIEVGISLSECIHRCGEKKVLNEAISSDLTQFMDEFMPIAEAGSLKVKSFVHTYAHISSKGTCSLKKSAVEALWNRRKSVLESLRGFEGGSSRMLYRRRGSGHYEEDEQFSLEFSKQSPFLDRLFDQMVFQKYRFIRYAK